ncbi:uncharacterized protein N7511_000860 [Penicillium nucicola]|uniref:uncharacterized protein n=1 Tax=Penicillium nucicola TaxID=1850975 RepID=UPI002544EF8A|nr:uncharacterized protein N7511_000860 [Penicillium nucicola]KAJ5775849.1 hypothetical protein N7511_000860 [Penicillium nucicola]
MNQLTASDVGALLASLRITPTQRIKEKFLQPLRDFDHTMRQFEPWFHDKSQVLIIGPDTVRLNTRIFKAEEYYKEKRPHQAQLEVCIFAIPHRFEKSAEKIKRLSDCYVASSEFSVRERAAALITGEKLLETWLIRQIKSTKARPSKVSGECLDVKVFNLFVASTDHDLYAAHLIRLEFAGMSFGMAWNIKDSMSKDSCWKARHGIPYIEATISGDIKVAVEDRSRRPKPKSLVFNSEYPDWDPETTVSIPIGSV